MNIQYVLSSIWIIACVLYATTAVIIEQNVEYSRVYEYIINSEVEYVLEYPESDLSYPFRVKVWSSNASRNFPALVVVRQERSVLSWTVPLVVDAQIGTLAFRNTSRTMCHEDMDLLNRMDSELMFRVFKYTQISQRLVITLSTSDVYNINVNLIAEPETTFFIEQNANYSLAISPSEPRYVYYKFSENDTDSVLILVDSVDDVCLTLSIQDSQCPVMDLNKDIKYNGKYATMNRKGGTTILKHEFPHGFFLVFVAKGDNYDCSLHGSVIPQPRRLGLRPQNRTSVVTFVIQPNVSRYDYMKASLLMLSIIVGFALVSIAITCSFFKWGRLAHLLGHRDEVDATDEESSIPVSDIEQYLENKVLFVAQLCKRPMRNKRKSLNYLWHVSSIAIFYSIPVVQLVITYQRTVNNSGDLDMCYYNFLCAHPAFGLSDYNHVLSNVGYVIIGLLFLGIVLYRQTTARPFQGQGIPIHYGFFYAMGVALIIEGILSACYHICPSQSSYQFDLSFMYIMAILCMVKLYNNRHPDINATAYSTFAIVGIGIFAATIGILNGTLVVWILFIIFYIFFCIYLSFKIYFLSYVFTGLRKFKDDVKKYGLSTKAFSPIKTARFILLILANIFNYTVVILGVVSYFQGNDFGTFLLATLMGNAILHSLFYIAMKFLNKEKMCAEAIIFGLLALIMWGFSGYFFLDYSTLWAVTPAESRERNKMCSLLQFYDSHDIWHVLSAAAMFLTFMFLLTLDDDLAMTPQETMPIF